MSSLFFEDLEVGQSWTSRARTVTETDVVGFAGLSGDFNPIHLDIESTKDGPYGRRIAHGVLGIAIATGFLDALGLFATTMAAMLGIDEWRFKAPIFIGDTIRLRMTIEAVRRTRSGTNGVVRRRLELINQDDIVVQHGVITVLIRCREPQSVESVAEGAGR